MKWIILVLFFTSFHEIINAQAVKISEQEAQLQGRFIDANKEMLMSRFDKAEEILNGIVKENETIGAVWYELARVNAGIGKDDKALSMINRAITLEPKNKWYLIYKGDLVERMNDHREAANVCAQLNKLEPKNPQHYENWAYHLIQVQEPAKAIEVYDNQAALMGITPELALKKMQVLEAMNKKEEAYNYLKELANTKPDITYLKIFAAYLVRSNRIDEATSVYERILKLDPKDTDARLAAAAGLRKSGKDIEFVQTLRELFYRTDVPYDRKMKELIPLIQKVADTGDTSLANALVDAVNVLNSTSPDNAKTYSALGDLYHHSNKLKSAIEAYQKSIQLDKSTWAVWEQLMTLQWDIRDVKSLLKTSNETYDLFPNLGTAAYWNAFANYGNANYKDALSAIQMALGMTRRVPAVQYRCKILEAQIHYRSNNLELGKAAIESAIAMNTNAAWAYYENARILAEINDMKSAANNAQKALTLEPNNSDALAAFAFVAMKSGSLQSADENYQKSFALGGNSLPQYLEEYGDLMALKGDKIKAKDYWLKSSNLGVETPSLKQKIQDAGQ